MKKATMLAAMALALAVLSGCGGRTDPVSSNPPPATSEPASATSEPAPETSEPAPETSEPAPQTSEPAPQTSEPAPQTSEPAPQTSEPAPQTSEPAPQTSEPAPQTSEPAPQTSEPAPQTSEPAPQTSEPAPQTSEPAPQTSEPVPQTSEPAPQTSEPAPQTSEPAPQTSEPAPQTSEPAPQTSEPAPQTSEPAPQTSENPFTPLPALEDSVGELRIHFYAADKKYSNYALWIWPTGGDGAEYLYEGEDSFGGVLRLGLSKFGTEAAKIGLGLIIKKAGSWAGQGQDLGLNISDLKAVDNMYHIWLKNGEDQIFFEEPPKSSAKASFTNETKISLSFDAGVSKITIYEDDIPAKILEPTATAKSGTLTLDTPASLTKTYTFRADFLNGDMLEGNVNTFKLFDSATFVNEFVDTNVTLGADYTPDGTTFRLWAPTSSEVKIRIYQKGTPEGISDKGDDTHYELAMDKGEKGIWSTYLGGDLDGVYYTYVVKNAANPDGVEVVDPYAKSSGVNGLRGMVLNFDRLNPEGWNGITPHNIDRKSLTVWETHVADVSSSSTWGGDPAKAKKFAGMYQTGTTYQGVKTGFDHIKELGVNAVQLIPIYDQANDELNPSFNWGYNPLNYNVLEGAYSSDPENGETRVREFKELVKAYNEAGINIIMDVVYNHVASLASSNFEKIVPGYYFRQDSKGSASNGSGCGNETFSDRVMFRKFMIDSVTFLAKEYKLGGYRFDLMAVHDLDTMDQLTAELKKINPGIVVYGEPWAGGTVALSSAKQASQANIQKFQGYGAFNDKLRDVLIAGGMNDKSTLSWVDGSPIAKDIETLAYGVKGGVSASKIDPDKAVSYVTCHDNYTLRDRFLATGRFTDLGEIEKMAKLAQGVAALSQGTFFQLAGEEFFRTKGGDHNSYESSYEVNQLDYALKASHPELFAYYQKLIELKQTLPGLHLDAEAAKAWTVSGEGNNSVLTFDLAGNAGAKYRCYFVNPKIAPGYTVNLSGAELVLDSLNPSKTLSGTTALEPYEVLVAKIA